MYFIEFYSLNKTTQMEVVMKDLLEAFILPVVIAGVGGYATYTYNQAKLKVDYANTVHRIRKIKERRVFD